jgi:hypothetical protein
MEALINRVKSDPGVRVLRGQISTYQLLAKNAPKGSSAWLAATRAVSDTECALRFLERCLYDRLATPPADG